MDFKGHFAMDQGRCHALTMLDDDSRYLLGLTACADETKATVQEHLKAIFRRYGRVERIWPRERTAVRVHLYDA